MKKTFKIMAICAVVITIIAYNVVIAATGKVNESNIRMRKEPNTKSDVIKNLYKNDEVEVLEKTGEWYKIKYDGKVGYMRSDLIDITSGTVVDAASTSTTTTTPATPTTETQTPTTASTTSETTATGTTTEKKEYTLKVDTSIKTYPVMYARNKMDVKKGEKVEKKEELGKWIKVKKDTSEGWILSTEIE